MRYALLLPVAAALLAVAAPAAGAATVSAAVTHNFDPGLPAKGVAPTVSTSSSVRVNAPSGEVNTMTLRPAGTDVVEVEDTTTPERAGTGCTQQSPNVVRCDVGGPLTVNATLGDKDDAWESGAVNATVNGGAGNDRLHAAGRLVGGDGDDTLTAIDASAVTGGPTVLDGGAGADHMTGGVVSYATRAAPVSVDLADPGTDGAPGEGDVIAAAQGAIGGAGDDTLLGTDGADVLYGGPGSDRIDGRGGDDVVDGGRAPGNVPAGNVADGAAPTAATPETVVGGPGNDQVGGAGTLDGGDGDDRITGDGSLTGGEGDDVLRGVGPGAVLDGGPGNDSVAEDASASPAAATFGSGPIVLRGGPGDDAVGPGGSGDVPALLDGGDGNDTLWAGNIADRGDAGPGDDTVRLIAGDTVGHVACGTGRDLLEPSGVSNPARPDCERVRPLFGVEGDKIVFPRRPAVAHGVARFRFRRTCGDLASIGAVRKCLVRVEVRSASERLVGVGSVRLHGGGATTVRVPLRRSLSRGKVTIRLHVLGADRDGRQEALNGGWSLA